MSCKSAIYTASDTAQSLTLTVAQPTSAIPLGTTIRRFGCNLDQSGTGVLAEGQGYYEVNASVSLTAATAGDYTVTLYSNGVAVSGADQTVTAAANDTISFSIPALVRNQNCGDTSSLTLVLSTTATLPVTVALVNVGLVVTKL